MEKATAPQMRQSLQIAQVMKETGIRFVPMPVLNDADFADLCSQMHRRLEAIERAVTLSEDHPPLSPRGSR